MEHEHGYDLDMIPALADEIRHTVKLLRQLASEHEHYGVALGIMDQADDLARAMDDVDHCPTVAERGTW